MVDEITTTGPSGGSGVPSITTTPVTPPPGPTTQDPEITPLALQATNDTLTQTANLDDVVLLIGGQIDLPPGRLSIEELQELIQGVILKLKKAIIDAQALDPLISERYHRSLARTAQTYENLHSELIDVVNAWKDNIKPKAEQVVAAYDDLVIQTNNFNNLMYNVWLQDRNAIQDLNTVINTYNNLTPQGIQNIYNSLSAAQRAALLSGLTQQQIDNLGGTEYAVAFQYINQEIGNYNQYVSGRPNIQQAIADIIQATNTYNTKIDQYNASLSQINGSRNSFSLPNLPQFTKTPVPDPQPLYETLPTHPSIIRPLIPPNTVQRMLLYRQPTTTDRINQFRSLLDAVPGVTTAQANTAVNAALAEGPFSTERFFLTEVRIQLGSLFASPSEGFAKFGQALSNFPIRYGLALPNTAQIGYIALPVVPGDIPSISQQEMMLVNFIPFVFAFIQYTTSFNFFLDLANSGLNEDIFFLSLETLNLTLPYGYLDTVNPVFQAAANAIGGLGLASAAIGLQSRSLEIIMSNILFRVSAITQSLPISARLYSRLQFSAMELISKSSLLSSIPAVRFLASRLGGFGSSSPVIYAAIALAFAGQIGNVVSSNIVRGLVNGQINRLGFYVRSRFRSANNAVQFAQRELTLAIRSGNPFRIASAVDRLTKAQVRLANVTRLFNTFGFLSIGNFGAFTTQIAAALNISLLGVSTSYYARALGLPNLVPQLFAQVTHLPPEDLLVALTARSTLLDVLENPVSLVFAKQSLANTLVYRLGYSTGYAAAIVNNALNQIVYSSVGLNSFSSFRNAVYQQFRAEGVSPYHANLLANETIALIRGDLGAKFLNVAFGINVDASFIASSLVNQLYGIDIGVAGSMMSNAIVRSLQFGGYGSRVRLRSELFEQYRDLGLSRGDAWAVANQTLNFIETVGVTVPLTRFPGLSNVLLGNPLLNRIAYGQGIIREEVIEDLQIRGLTNTQAEFVADQLDAIASGNEYLAPEQLRFEITLREAIRRSLTGGGIYQTHREFRDRLSYELRSVGFRLNDALYLANSVANYGAFGDFLHPFGIGGAQLAALNNSLVNELRNSGLSSSQAARITEIAYARSRARAPFLSSGDFYENYKQEIFRELFNHTGSVEGSYLFDRAVAGVSGASQILGLAALTEQISNSAIGILRPDLGGALANRLREQLLSSLVGGRSIDEISDEEQRNPLSLLSLVNDQVRRLRNQEEEADQIRMLRKLIQLLQRLGVPNASVGFALSSIGDNPGTFFGAVNVSEAGSNYQALQIPT